MENGYSDFSETESLDLRTESRDKIAKLFPEVMKDGLFDFDVLKELLGGDFAPGAERYGLFWPGKHDAIKTALEPTNLTLRPLEEQSRNWESTKNLYIEGDNLETLKLLQKAYANKVKMIYLDPPYNTGGDFVYSDRFKTSKGAYLKENDFLDEDGNVLSTSVNTKVNPEYHTQWLNMMYPRLKLAWNLLQDDGVLYVSIDDNEASNLKKMLDEVFGENMFIAQIPWRKRTAKSDVPFGISQDYEWVFAYAKSEKFKASVEGAERKYFESADFPGRPWRSHDLTKQTTAEERPNSYFTIVNPKTGEEYPANPNRTWVVTKETFKKYYDEDRIIFPGDYDFLKISKPALRYWKEDDMAKAGEDFGRVAMSTKLPDDIGTTAKGTKDFARYFDTKEFTFPKPVELIRYLIDATFGTGESGIVLDFFSGSGTTGEAVMRENIEKNKNIRFILVQLNETAQNSSFDTIPDIARQRLNRAGDYYQESTDANFDYGYRTFKLDDTNIKSWASELSDGQTTLQFESDNLVQGRTSKDVVYEILLKKGLDLSIEMDVIDLGEAQLFDVFDGTMFIAIGNGMDRKVATYIIERRNQYEEGGLLVTSNVVFVDESFTNVQEKLNAISMLQEAGYNSEDIESI